MTDVVIVEEGSFTPVNWWIFLLQGLIAVIFGLILMVWAPAVFNLISYFLGALIVIYSISIIIKGAVGVGQGSGKSRALLVILGIIGIIIGLLVLLNIEIMWLTIAVFIAIWAFISGFGDLWLGFTAEKESGWYRVLLIITGIIALAIGFFVILMPLMMDYVFVMVLGAFLFVLGIVSLITGFIVQAKLKG
jgi:uncharacterized membrane protein HdeD (DUF308 family)